jgi:hypothetical protein
LCGDLTQKTSIFNLKFIKMKKITKNIFIAYVLSFMVSDCFAQTITAGHNHSLSVCGNDIPQSFGQNAYGQLGDGTTVNKNTPISVSSLSNIIAVSAGRAHTLYLKDDGTVWASGSNNYGQLGLGIADTIRHSTPVQITSLSGITAIAAGGNHSLFLKNDSTVWACGYNVRGELGDGTYNQRGAPIIITSLNNIIAIAGGGTHSIFLRSDSTVWACGRNVEGQIGNGATGLAPSPVQVTSLTGVAAIAGGGFFSLYLKGNGTVWGSGQNMAGQLGDGTTTDRSTPVQSTTLSNITSIAAGGNHSLFLKSDSTVWVTGYNGTGQLGDGTTVFKKVPVQATSLNSIIEIAGGGDLGTGKSQSLFLKNDGSVWACGDNSFGQLGDGTNTQRNTPVQITSLCNATFVQEEKKINEISIYPNPNAGIFHITISTKQKSFVQILNILGEEVLHKTIDEADNEINISTVTPGIYTLRVVSDNRTSTSKFIKQ